MKRKPYIPKDLQVLRKSEEIAACANCVLPDCVGAADRRCPARQLDYAIRSRVRRARHQQQRTDKAAGRGYWPDIHGED